MHLPVGRHLHVQAAHRQHVETLCVLKRSRSIIIMSCWWHRNTQQGRRFWLENTGILFRVELSLLWGCLTAELLTGLENPYGSRFPLKAHDPNRPDHETAVKPSLVAAAAEAEKTHRSVEKSSWTWKNHSGIMPSERTESQQTDDSGVTGDQSIRMCKLVNVVLVITESQMLVLQTLHRQYYSWR